MNLQKLTLHRSLSAAVLAILLGASSASAMSIKMDTFHSGAGGNYSFQPISGIDTSAYTHGFTGTWFGTFCLEKNEFFNPNQTYDVAFSGGAQNGGAGRQPGDPANFDPLSQGTAFLYEGFALGSLGAGFSYTSSALSLQLQNMIWFLEDEQGSWGSSPNLFSNLLESQYGSGWQTLAKQNYTGSAVQVVNLTQNGVNKQDQVFFAGRLAAQVPEGGTTLALLSLSLFSLGFATRRVRAEA